MKTLLLVMFSAAAACCAEMPAHSISGDTVIDLKEFAVSVPYGPAELMTAASICIAREMKNASVYFGTDFESVYQGITFQRTPSGSCATVIIPHPKSSILQVEITTSSVTRFTASGVQPVPSPDAVRQR